MPLISDVILPVILVEHDATGVTARSVCGTGFTLPGGVFVTCWHCVQDEPLPGLAYAAAAREGPDGRSQALDLKLLAQDENGADIALARLPDWHRPTEHLILGGADVVQGMDVGTYGYPLPERDATGDGFLTHSRTLRGYVTRGCLYERPGWGPTPSIELDMPAPSGVSGAPLLTEDRVIGMIYGTHAAYTIEEEVSVDPATGVTTPEVRRVYPFGLALDLPTLAAARGPATDGESLYDYVRRHSPAHAPAPRVGPRRPGGL